MAAMAGGTMLGQHTGAFVAFVARVPFHVGERHRDLVGPCRSCRTSKGSVSDEKLSTFSRKILSVFNQALHNYNV